MKKFMLLLNLLCMSLFVYGQDDATPKIRRHTITVSYAVGSLYGIVNSMTNDYTNPIVEEGQYGFSLVGYGKRTFSGVYGLSYSYKPIQRLEVGAALSYEQHWELWKVYNDPNGVHERIQRDHYLSPTVNVYFIYLSNKWIDLYSGIDVGAQWIWNNVHSINSKIEPRNEFNFTCQVWAINLRAKYKALFISGSYGFGFLGMARLGIGVQF